MENLVLFIKKTKELKVHLEKTFSFAERDKEIAKLEVLIKERQRLLQQLPDLSTLPEHTKKDLVKLEKEIHILLKKQRNEITNELKMFQLQKKKSQQYADPYGDFSIDGTFLDKKK